MADNSYAYYDLGSEIDDIKDKGEFIGNDIHELMLNMNENFSRRIVRGGEEDDYRRTHYCIGTRS